MVEMIKPDHDKPKDGKFAINRLVQVAKINREIAESCDVLIEILNSRPDLDKHFCKAFGIQSQ